MNTERKQGDSIMQGGSDSDSEDGEKKDGFLLGFAFGNVDERGKAEVDYLDKVRFACARSALARCMRGIRQVACPSPRPQDARDQLAVLSSKVGDELGMEVST